MSREKGRKKTPQKQKNPIKKRLETVEKVISDGLDNVISEINNLHHNDQVIAGAMETHDNTIAAIRSLLVDKGIITDQEIDDRCAEISKIREDTIAAAAKKAEEAAEAQKAEEAAADAARPDADLVEMHRKASEAGEEEYVPDGAFVFGG